MAVLLLRLAAPLQAWGDESKFETRRTLPFPTKSGVIGMLAAALGRSREEPADDLSALGFGVRIDREGELLRDYHTVRTAKQSYITNRYYLSDAIFLVGLESDDKAFLESLETALKAPAFPLFLGRRSCPPTLPLVLGIRDKALYEVLSDEPWLLPEYRQARIYSDDERKLRIIVDDITSSTVIRDVPLSFSKKRREFGWRGVRDCGYIEKKRTDETETKHDPFRELR